MTQDDGEEVRRKAHYSYQIEGDFVQKPSVQVIAKIAKALDLSIEDLLK